MSCRRASGIGRGLAPANLHSSRRHASSRYNGRLSSFRLSLFGLVQYPVFYTTPNTVVLSLTWVVAPCFWDRSTHPTETASKHRHFRCQCMALRHIPPCKGVLSGVLATASHRPVFTAADPVFTDAEATTSSRPILSFSSSGLGLGVGVWFGNVIGGASNARRRYSRLWCSHRTRFGSSRQRVRWYGRPRVAVSVCETPAS